MLKDTGSCLNILLPIAKGEILQGWEKRLRQEAFFLRTYLEIIINIQISYVRIKESEANGKENGLQFRKSR